jgi:hypothetical protein
MMKWGKLDQFSVYIFSSLEALTTQVEVVAPQMPSHPKKIEKSNFNKHEKTKVD